jgi:hypothetical protein
MRVIPYLTLAAGAAAALLKGDDDCSNEAWAQCGGTGWAGDTCCPPGYNCTVDNDWFSGCALEDLCLVVQFGQCGGTDSDGNPWPEDQKCCPDGFECSYTNPFYSQCIEKGSNNTDCSGPYEQCGGQGYNGTTCCVSGYECTEDAVNPQWYSGCTLIPVCTNPAYGQCGGVDSDGNPWLDNHDDCCPDGFDCQYSTAYYSQCLESTADSKKSPTKKSFDFHRAMAKQKMKGLPNRVTDEPCKTDADCVDGADPHCVVESQYYSACVDCAPSSFSDACEYMSGSFLLAAEETCGQGCDGRCPSGNDKECVAYDTKNETSCVVADGADACIDCSSQAAFDDKCFWMSDDWVIAAQDKCGLTCTARCPTHSDSDCASGMTCVVQTGGDFDQCIDCTPAEFESQCKYWSAEIRSAAEAACGETCDMSGK